MRLLVLGVALMLSASGVVQAGRFPRAVKGNGFLKVPVGTVDRARKSKRDGESPILTVLENKDFFYATESELDLETSRNLNGKTMSNTAPSTTQSSLGLPHSL